MTNAKPTIINISKILEMNKKKLKQVITAMAFLAFTASFTSCNRGYGCPSNFSVQDNTIEVVKTVTYTVAKAIIRIK